MASPLRIFIRCGVARSIYHDEFDLRPALAGESALLARRASHVEPTPEGWTADLSPIGGPVLGPFQTRAAALAAEVTAVEMHLRSGGA